MFWSALRQLGSHPPLVLMGSFGAGNVGDELLLAGFLAELQRCKPGSRVTIFSADPVATTRQHLAADPGRAGWQAVRGLPAGPRSLLANDFWPAVTALRAARAVVFPGGGLLTDSETPRAVWVWSLPALVAHFLGKPVFWVGQSLGPLTRGWTRRLAAAVLRRAAGVSVRDSGSEPVALGLGVSSDRLAVEHDSALFLARAWTPARRRLPRQIVKIAVAARDFPTLSPAFWAEFTAGLAQLLRWKKQTVRLTFLPFEIGAHDDRVVWQKLRAKVPALSAMRLEILPTEPAALLARLARFDCVVGLRLHSLVAARLAGVPAVGVAYSPKVAEFARQAGQICLPPEALTAASLVAAVRTNLAAAKRKNVEFAEILPHP